jgi:hypothetical protein
VSEKLVFCNCLFTTDSIWNVKVGRTYPFVHPEQDNGIDNANVFIVSNKGDTINLSHRQNGEYLSGGEKPVEGVNYQLFVIINGDTISSTPSSIPVGVDVEILEFNELPGTVQIGYYNMDEVYAIKCKLIMTEPKIQGIMVRSLISESTNKTFNRIDCYSGTANFEHFQFETYTLLGNFYEISSFDIYVWNFLEGEYWIDIKALSAEAYLYYEGYIAQLSNRIDYNNIQDPVYSNINNGVGIFAGYSQKMIRVK